MTGGETMTASVTGGETTTAREKTKTAGGGAEMRTTGDAETTTARRGVRERMPTGGRSH